MKQLDNGTFLRICPDCHVAILYRLEEDKGWKCPTCGFTVLVKRHHKVKK